MELESHDFGLGLMVQPKPGTESLPAAGFSEVHVSDVLQSFSFQKSLSFCSFHKIFVSKSEQQIVFHFRKQECKSEEFFPVPNDYENFTCTVQHLVFLSQTGLSLG